MTHPTMLERAARGVARVMNGSITPEVGTHDDIPVTPEDIYAARAVLTTLLDPTEEMVAAGGAAEFKPSMMAAGHSAGPDLAALVFTAMIREALEPRTAIGDEG